MIRNTDPVRVVAWQPGTEGVIAAGRGIEVESVDAVTFFERLLSTRVCATRVFLALADVLPRMSAEQAKDVDDALAHTYWTVYEAVLTPPSILTVLSSLQRQVAGPTVLGFLDDVQQDFTTAESMEDLHALWLQARVYALLMGAHGEADDQATASAELLLDYLFLQRVVALDLRRVESLRESGELRAQVVSRLESNGELQFERAIAYLLDAARIAQEIPSTERVYAEEFAQQRLPFAAKGLVKLLVEEELADG